MTRHADRVGDQRTRGDAAHAELRHRPEPEAERAAEHDLADRGIEDDQRRQLHVAGAAQDRGQRIHQPRHHRAAEEDLDIADRVRQHVAAAAEHFQQRRPEHQHDQRERQPEADADQQRMRRQRRGAFDVAGAERARDRRCHAAAHRAARHRHGQDHERKHQRHRRQRFDAEPADIGGLGDHHAGARAERDHVRPGEPQQRAQDRTVEQRIPRRRRDRREAADVVLGDRNFGDADIGHCCFRFLAAARSSQPRTGRFLAPDSARLPVRSWRAMAACRDLRHLRRMRELRRSADRPRQRRPAAAPPVSC